MKTLLLKTKRSKWLVVFFIVLAGIVLRAGLAHASFNANDVMDDGIFDNASSMSAQQIDTWLNSNFPNSCISTNNGFSAPEPIGYSPTPSSHFSYGANVSAGTVIYDAAHVYGLNPQVILATLEKESSVVSGNASYHCTYINTAMGYDCPDAGNCPQYPATESGFSQQVIHAAWMLKFHEQRSLGNVGWDVQVTNFPHSGDVWDNSDDPQSCYGGRMTQGTYVICPSGAASYYDGYTTIDNTTVHLDTGATAALYDYTPHFHGNELFDNYFLGWFGAIYATPYADGFFSQSGYPQLNPGQQTTVYMEYQNLGTNTWYDDTSIGSAPSGTYPVHLATSHALNRQSAFGAGWVGDSRPAMNFSAVYLSDGSTFASNQHEATPGEVVKFSFTITIPYGLTAASYPEYFQPVAEGSSTGLFNDPGTYMLVTVNPVPSLTWSSQSGYPTVAPSQNSQAYLRLTNNGSVPLYDNSSIGSAPSGTYPVNLATANPLGRSSNFSASWPSSSIAASNFASVYESDGVTLAANQHVALPGQIIKFNFDFAVPAGYTNGSYNEYFQPIEEGNPSNVFAYQGIYYTITVPSTAVVNYTQTPTSTSLAANEPSTFTYQIINAGNAALPGTSQLYTAGGSGFATSSWSSSNIISSLGATLAAGQSATLNVPVTAPNVGSSTTLPFDLSIVSQGTTTAFPGSSNTQKVSISPANYHADFAGQSAYPTLVNGQSAGAYIMYKNTGNQPWYDDTSIGSTTWANAYPVHLATSHSLNRASGFAANWPSSNRADADFTAVYESDGVTLAANQHVVQPGQIAKFGFQLSPAMWIPANTYSEYFQPVAEGTPTGAFNDVGSFLRIGVVAPVYSSKFYGQSGYPTISKGSSGSAYLEFTNIGNTPWYDDTSIGSAPSGTHPVHLATANPLNRSSDFSASWPCSNRADADFTAVYESGGVTLAANQHVVQPGQIAKFGFSFSVPSVYTNGSYKEYFQPVAEGSTNGAFNYLGAYQQVNVVN